MAVAPRLSGGSPAAPAWLRPGAAVLALAAAALAPEGAVAAQDAPPQPQPPAVAPPTEPPVAPPTSPSGPAPQEGTPPAAPASPEFLADDLVRMTDGTIVRYYRVNYVPATLLAEELKVFGTPSAQIVAAGSKFIPPAPTKDSGAPKVAIKEDVQSVVRIRDLESNWPTLERALAMLDVPQPQVRVEARVMELTFDDQFKLGMTSKVTRPVGDTFLQSVETKFPNTLDAVNGATAVFKETDKFVVFDYALQAVEQGAKADVLSQPSILASQGEIAVIRAGDQEPYVKQNLTGNSVTTTTEFKDVGIRLEVQPLLIGREAIRVRILAESSRLGDFRVTATSVNQQVVNPVISQRTADTVVTVPDGETLVIGGLEQREVRDTRTGLPFLMDLPVLGWVFGSTSKRDARTTIFFWITLTIERPEEARLFVPPSERARLEEAGSSK